MPTQKTVISPQPLSQPPPPISRWETDGGSNFPSQIAPKSENLEEETKKLTLLEKIKSKWKAKKAK